MGDSLSAGFGIEQSRSWVSLLEQRLKSGTYPYRVFNASISGETSQGGLNRLPRVLEKNPSIVIIELGANDGLRGLSLQHLKTNLDRMIAITQSTGARVLLVGMKLPSNYGPRYSNEFYGIYKQLAEKYKTKLVPFLLEGVATKRELMQSDNLHPTSEAQPLLLENVWPHLFSLLNDSSDKSASLDKRLFRAIPQHNPKI